MTNNTTTNEQGNVVLEMSMSLDGYIAGRNVGMEQPMGDGGERLHDWMFTGKTEREIEEFATRSLQATAAFVMGRRTFDLGVGPWGENPTFHAPCFVLSQVGQATITKAGGTTYTFVTDGIESVVAHARAAAGSKRITVMGGANAAQQCLRAGLVDEIVIHLVPVLLGDGTRLFDRLGPESIELERMSVIESPGVTHLRFRVVK